MSKKLTIGDIARKIAGDNGMTIAAAEEIVTETLKAIKAGLLDGREVFLNNFGTFRIQKKPARMGRDPRTGCPLSIPPKNAVKFSASSDLDVAINA